MRSVIEKNFYIVDLIPVTQNEEIFYIGKINVNYIKDLFTISPAEYSISNIKAKYDLDDPDIGEYIEELKKTKSEEGYQRYEIEKRVKEIAMYLQSTHDYHIIPNSIILSLSAELVDSEEELVNLTDPNTLSFFIFEEENHARLFIPKALCRIAAETKDNKPILVIDGNHRLLGIKRHVEDYAIEDFEIVITVLVNRDTVDQAEIFKTVNYKIKAVNKSYYYQIMGEFETGEKEYIYLHYLARLLNENEKSPFYGRIKMLGRTYKSKFKQTISQAFFVEHIYEWLIMKKNRINIKEQDVLKRLSVLRYLFIKDEESIVTKLLVRYFTAIKKAFEKEYGDNQWDSSDNSLLKAIGIGAFIEIFPIIYINLVFDKGCINHQEDLDTVKSDDFLTYLNLIFKEVNVLEIINDRFSKGSGKGMIKAFAELLAEVLIKQNKAYKEKEGVYINWYRKNIIDK